MVQIHVTRGGKIHPGSVKPVHLITSLRSGYKVLQLKQVCWITTYGPVNPNETQPHMQKYANMVTII